MSDVARIRPYLDEVDTTAICDVAKDTRVLSAAIRCRSRNPRICAPASTVRCRDDFFGVLRAIEQASSGEVIMVDGGGRETALAGELFARAAQARGLSGIVVDGGYRDIGYIRTCELPVYSRHIFPMAGATKELGELQLPITCGGVPISPGDIVIADAEGLIVLDPTTAERTVAEAREVKAAEARVIARLDQGVTLSDCLNVTEHAQHLAGGRPSRLRFTV